MLALRLTVALSLQGQAGGRISQGHDGFFCRNSSVDRVVAFDPSIDDYKFELNTFEVVV
jgi:hypothetical protein